jgi:presenilin-like A22 family membrane protease
MRFEMLWRFLLFFLAVNFLGLLVANFFVGQPELSQAVTESVSLVNDNKQDPWNSIALLAYVLVATAVFLLVIQFFPGRMPWLFRLVESIAVFFVSVSLLKVLWSYFFPLTEIVDFVFVAVGIVLVLLRLRFSENLLLRNLVTLLLASYIGALIGTGLGVYPILLFVILLAVYDFIAVFKTKHMITLAKAVTKKNLAFSYAIPTKEHQFELGTGDLVLPLAFSSSVLGAYAVRFPFPNYFFPALAILASSLVGLLITLEYSSRNIGKALPALPLQTVFMVLVFLVFQFLVPF